jgi:hypothetical protein
MTDNDSMTKAELLELIHEDISNIEKDQRIWLVKQLMDKIPRSDIIDKSNSIHIKTEKLAVENIKFIYDNINTFKEENIKKMNKIFSKFDCI